MTTLVVNGRSISAEIAGRTHLADFLRDHLLLTGTHTGCEHGVCGACTVLLDDEPIRACITFAALCEGAAVRTIEGLDDDPVTARLREAFSAEHALQCGYCTPGMIVTARDIVLRLPDVDDDRIRLELAGNLCRCTGYNGIVRAIRRVLDERLDLPPRPLTPVPAVTFGAVTTSTTAASTRANTDGLHQRLHFAVTADQLWTAVQDPALVASAIPGATLTSVDGDTIAGEMAVALGPVRVRFAGQAVLTYDQPARAGQASGGGNDQSSGTRISAEAKFRVHENGPGSCILSIDIAYELRGPLSQLAKARVVESMAGEIASQFGAALAARLRGEAAPKQAPLSAAGLVFRMFRRWLAGLLRTAPDA